MRAGGPLAKKRKMAGNVEVNVLAHSLVPPMRILSQREKENILKEYNIGEDKLPRIAASDPAARALNAKPGDVLKIERSDITGKYSFYRLVVQ